MMRPGSAQIAAGAEEDLTSLGLSIFKVSSAAADARSYISLITQSASNGLLERKGQTSRLRHAHDGGLNEWDRRMDFAFRYQIGHNSDC